MEKIVGIEAIYNQVEFDLINSLALLNLNLTMKESQYPFVVRELVDTFSNESIQDFQLCFRNGVKGRYGKIYNIDLSVLALWMSEYLEEKYQVIESGTVTDSTEALPEVDYERFKQRKAQEATKPTDFKKERESQLNRLNYTPPSEEYVRTQELKRQWARECTDLHSGKILPNSPNFNDWLKNIK